MSGHIWGKRLSSFQLIITGFLAAILTGTLLLCLPAAAGSGRWTPVGDSLFTAVSAVCVTGLVVQDTAMYWSMFGQAVILSLIQIGGLGVVTVAVLIATASGRKISLLQRSVLQESISANQVGGILRLTGFICRVVLLTELLGVVIMLPTFCHAFGRDGIWMAVFHSVSAFCNAGFDVMGKQTGPYSSMVAFSASPGIVLPLCALILIGGLGFLTWDDIARNRFHLRRYSMQSKMILSATAVLTLIPSVIFFLNDFAGLPLKERICVSLFQAVTPRTAGFSLADMETFSSAGRALTASLMLVGGSPGSTAGGMKTTTIAVLLANALAVVRQRKNAQMFGRRIEEETVKCASTLMMLYLVLAVTGAFIISLTERLPFDSCIFETASAIGTVGLTLGITPALGAVSRAVLIGLMFFGRVGGLTLLSAALSSREVKTAQFPVGKINVG